ncbi:hypothetical protein [Arachidicoccus soli]|uniref:Outer membrane protein beta-barrel domain-containing protein n=1 Tax=Arachidicoccus soli TaxID=2341117 RepID=A0A386HSK4_9BACT|nr:hypothetical protein [Arachidicoccus soli]AYD48958.1 hypothetical protein D6B99_15870 [Arachidicoccus soli]
MKKIITLLTALFCCHAQLAVAQQYGYWNIHTGIDAGGSLLHFNQVPSSLPAGSSPSPGIMGSLFFNFLRVKETSTRDLPTWGIKVKFNFQTVGYKDPNKSNTYYANYFTIPLLLKIRLYGIEGFYTMSGDYNSGYFPQYHKRNKFSIFLYAGPQYDYVYSQSSSYGSSFSNKALIGTLHGGVSGLGGLEFNFETVLLDLSWQETFQGAYLKSDMNNQLKASGPAIRVGLPFGNVYKNY